MGASILRVIAAALLLSHAAAAETAPNRPASRPAARSAARPPTVPAQPGTAAQRPPAKPATKPTPHRPTPHAPTPPVVMPPEPERAAPPTKGSNSGLPLPRFNALRSDEVYMRSGPGPRYPIEWVYKRRDLPLEIEREFDIWRLVRDQEGVRGWVNTQTLSPRRTAVITGGERVLRRDANEGSAAVAKLKPGVLVRLRTCDAASDWCQAQVQDYRGWIKRSDVWGTYPGEAIQ